MTYICTCKMLWAIGHECTLSRFADGAIRSPYPLFTRFSLVLPLAALVLFLLFTRHTFFHVLDHATLFRENRAMWWHMWCCSTVMYITNSRYRSPHLWAITLTILMVDFVVDQIEPPSRIQNCNRIGFLADFCTAPFYCSHHINTISYNKATIFYLHERNRSFSPRKVSMSLIETELIIKGNRFLSHIHVSFIIDIL